MMGEWDATEKRAHRAEAERDEALAQLADRDARLAAIGELHHSVPSHVDGAPLVCNVCRDESHPCETAVIVYREAQR